MYRSFLNMDLLSNICDFDGDFPVIKKQELKTTDFISFNKCKSNNDKNKGVHFFIHDYQFERCWRMPNLYIPVLNKFKNVLSPDFSMYIDMPLTLQQFNHYRKQFLGAFWQKKGINVIPTISFGDKSSFDFCFRGYEKGSTVAISVTGVKKVRNLFFEGYNEMLDRINPEKIIVFGDISDLDLQGNILNIKNKYRG